MTHDPSADQPLLARISDDELARLLAGSVCDREVFDEVVRRHQDWLGRHARSMTHGDAESEDLVNATWFRLYQALRNHRVGPFENALHLRGWLVTVIRN